MLRPRKSWPNFFYKPEVVWQNNHIGYHDINSILEKELSVMYADTVSNPVAMVVHPHTASVTELAMTSSWWLQLRLSWTSGTNFES